MTNLALVNKSVFNVSKKTAAVNHVSLDVPRFRFVCRITHGKAATYMNKHESSKKRSI